MKIRLSYRDGVYSAEEHTEKHAAVGFLGVEVESAWWKEYREHCERDRKWQDQLQALDNIQYELEHPEDDQP